MRVDDIPDDEVRRRVVIDISGSVHPEQVVQAAHAAISAERITALRSFLRDSLERNHIIRGSRVGSGWATNRVDTRLEALEARILRRVAREYARLAGIGRAEADTAIRNAATVRAVLRNIE